MSRQDEKYAELLLEWARTLDEHRDPDYEAWIQRAQRKHQTERKAA